ncbi:putative PEP-binding protein [Ensifer canadensis]
MPKAEEQEAFYRSVLKQAGGKPRDFPHARYRRRQGGVPISARQEEENPALGWRAIRLSLDRPGPAAHAAARHAACGLPVLELKLMLPMVTEVSESCRTRASFCRRKCEHLSKLGARLPRKLQFGAMLEVPALLWQLDELMSEVDFVSVGSNDLFQFAMAVDRGNARVSDRFDVLGKPFLRILRDIVRGGERHQTPVTLCGEMASKPTVGHGAARSRLPLGVDVADGDRSDQGDAARPSMPTTLGEVTERGAGRHHATRRLCARCLHRLRREQTAFPV